MDDAAFLEQHRLAHLDTVGGTCGGTHDTTCSESAAWRLDRPWGGRSLNGYCTTHAAVKIRADEHAVLLGRQRAEHNQLVNNEQAKGASQ